jgi:hypothetical protein
MQGWYGIFELTFTTFCGDGWSKGCSCLEFERHFKEEEIRIIISPVNVFNHIISPACPERKHGDY